MNRLRRHHPGRKNTKNRTCEFFGFEGGHLVVLGVVPEHPEEVFQVLVLDFAVTSRVEEEKRLKDDDFSWITWTFLSNFAPREFDVNFNQT